MKKQTRKFFVQIIQNTLFCFAAYCSVCWWMCDKYAPLAELPEDKTHVPLSDATDQPALYDGSYFCDTLTIVRPGHPKLDLWKVPSFRGIDRDSIDIQVFYDGIEDMDIKPGDRVIVEGVFKQMERDFYFRDGYCLFAVKVKVLPRKGEKPAK